MLNRTYRRVTGLPHLAVLDEGVTALRQLFGQAWEEVRKRGEYRPDGDCEK